MTTDHTHASPGSDDQPVVLLHAAADLIRRFNHATHTARPGWRTPADSYAALGALAEITGRLTQAITQAGRPIAASLHQDRLYTTAGTTPVTVAQQTAAGLDGAAERADHLTAALRGAQGLVSTLGTTTPPSHDNDDTACRRCHRTFQPDDHRFDGYARHRDTPWCRACVDNCDDGHTEHICVICDPTRYGQGERR